MFALLCCQGSGKPKLVPIRPTGRDGRCRDDELYAGVPRLQSVNFRSAKVLGLTNSMVDTAVRGPHDRITVYGLKLDFNLPQAASDNGA